MRITPEEAPPHTMCVLWGRDEAQACRTRVRLWHVPPSRGLVGCKEGVHFPTCAGLRVASHFTDG